RRSRSAGAISNRDRSATVSAPSGRVSLLTVDSSPQLRLEREQAETTPMEAGGQLPQRRLLPPAVAVLQHDQPPLRRQRERRPSVPLPRAAPSLPLAIPPPPSRRTQRLLPPQPHRSASPQAATTGYRPRLSGGSS